MMIPVSAVPIPQTAFAVFAKEDGTPEFRKLLAMVTMEKVTPNDDSTHGLRCISAVALGGGHLNPVDWQPGHVGYSADQDPAPWLEAC